MTNCHSKQPQLPSWMETLCLNVALALALMAGTRAALLAAEPQPKGAASSWEKSIVTLDVARKKYDYYQPWSRRQSQVQKTGLVVGERQVLTTADEMFDRTLVRLQKG